MLNKHDAYLTPKFISFKNDFEWMNKNEWNVSRATNQHIRMISEGSCDTEDWSNAGLKIIYQVDRKAYR